MSETKDIVVTLPKSFGLDHWIEEGDAAGEQHPSNEEWGWFMGGRAPRVEAGCRVYVVYNTHLIGFSELVRVAITESGYALVRGGKATAVTIEQSIPGFRGPRFRWWDRELEYPFLDWMTAAKTPKRGAA